MDDYNGLYKTNPKLSLTMMLALFSLAGIPPVAGFFGKFFPFYFSGSFRLLLACLHCGVECNHIFILLPSLL
ncbi:MAG: hypothetical protein MZU84_00980 [Sphingobacterium sp.]|nr:hypothetical protein [Sphingobacterium sp.]